MATIALDIDGCFAAFTSAFNALLRSHGSPIADTEWPTWNHGRDVSTPTQWSAAWAAIESSDTWWATLPRHRDVTERVISLLDMLDQKHALVWVTSRSHGRNAHAQTCDWIETYLKLWRPQVILTPRSKPHALYAIGADVVVEDCLDNLNGARILNREAMLVLVDRPYNREGHMQPNIERVGTTEKALEMVAREVGV